ncbi:MAG: hypothetical protein AB1429_08215 [Pseudomonadota bacterium]|jgi:hypothetical protein
MKRLAISASAFVGIASLAVAAPENLTRSTSGYTYFNRPGADFTKHDADLRDCIVRASAVHPMMAALGGGLLGELIDNNREAVRLRSNAENCMLVKGWRVVRLATAEGERLAAVSPSELTSQLAPWIGSEPPHGDVVRVWSNAALKPDTIRDAMPAWSGGVSLSIKTVKRDEQLSKETADAVHPSLWKRCPDPKYSNARMLSGAEFESVPADMAIVFASVRDIGPKHTIFLQRKGPDEGTQACRDNKASFVWLGAGKRPTDVPTDQPFETIQAFAVPAGRWAVLNLGDFVTFYCLGAPYIDLNPGDVVYAGHFDFTASNWAPDLTFAPEKVVSAEADGLRRKIRPATWTNGDTEVCTAGYISALEFPNTPYAAGYVWGGAARRN